VGLSDGSILLLSGSGKEEKRIKGAHAGTVTHVSFGMSGQSLVSTGEDGVVKLWSRNGL
jgi:intraflagellar transport protein 80